MPTAQPELRVVLYSVNGTGLGHVTRLMAIARWLRGLLNGLNLKARIFFLSCSEADALIGRQGFPSFKIPSKTALRRASVSDPEAIQLIRGLAQAALAELEPDVLVVDTFPTGSYDELLPILGQDAVTKVFVFREQRADYARRIPYAKLLSTFHLLLIPHPPDFFELPFEPPPGLEVAWAGDIIFGERNELWTKAKARRSLGIGRDRTVVYTAAGGGGDPDSERTLRTIVGAVRELPKVHILVGAGPLYQKPGKSGRDLAWSTYYPVSRLFRAFDFAISSSGYNTVNELLFFGLPAILYAQVRGADDQLARARRVAAGGGALVVEKLSRANLREALQQMADRELRARMSKVARTLVPENGARRAAEHILRVALARKFPGLELDSYVAPTVRITGDA